jgi:hypothetical protein
MQTGLAVSVTTVAAAFLQPCYRKHSDRSCQCEVGIILIEERGEVHKSGASDDSPAPQVRSIRAIRQHPHAAPKFDRTSVYTIIFDQTTHCAPSLPLCSIETYITNPGQYQRAISGTGQHLRPHAIMASIFRFPKPRVRLPVCTRADEQGNEN